MDFPQPRRIARMLAATPELRALLADPDCLQDAWLDALLKSIGEANCFDLPDICPWTLEQVALLRSDQWVLLDIEHIVEEIEDLNISHRHQLAHRLAILMAHLLKWKYQPDRHGDSWKRTIRDQRQRIATMLKKMPSLRHLLDDPEWNEEVWTDALGMAVLQTELTYRPKVREWSLEQVLAEDYLPS